MSFLRTCSLCLLGWMLVLSVGCGKSACPYVCKAQQRRCIAQGLLVCTNNVTSGCNDWGLIPCQPGQTCQQQGNSFGCVGTTPPPTGNCSPLQAKKKCVGQQVYWFDGCDQRGELVVNCGAGFVCKEGTCAKEDGTPPPPCGSKEQICARGERRCVGQQVQNCKWDSQKGCGSWEAPQACGSGRVCKDGYCQVGGTECPNSCKVGTKRCVGIALQSCEPGARAGCGQWGKVTQCPSGQMCLNGVCERIPSNCPNSCVLGAKRCGPNQSVELCKPGSGGSCPSWQVDRQCPSGFACKGGDCINPCPNECSSGQKRCLGQEIQHCKVDGNCAAWNTVYRCGSLQACKEDSGRHFCACPPGYEMALDGSTCTQDPSTGSCNMNAEERKVLQLVNLERARSGLSPLFCHINLVSVSRDWSNTQCNRGYVGHDGFTGRLRRSALGYTAGGENVAAGQDSPEAVLQAWMNSEGHRNNILNAAFTHMGPGYANCGKGYKHYWTQIFIQRR